MRIPHLLSCVLAMGAGLARADYFPAVTGGTWTYSYTLRTGYKIPPFKALVDSGTLTWKVADAPPGAGVSVAVIIQSRLLHRRRREGEFDSVYTRFPITVDTLRFLRPEAGFLSFLGGDSCLAFPHAWREPRIAALPIVTDTSVRFGFGVHKALRVQPARSCFETATRNPERWDMVAGDGLGVVAATITRFILGPGYEERRTLLAKDGPVALHRPAQASARDAMKAGSGRFRWTDPTGVPSLVDPRGRLLPSASPEKRDR